jgi:uncharacterized protein YbjT (DUF2867 family)
MILVTGATGTTGGAVLDELLGRGVAVRGLTRSPERAEQLRARGADAAVGDLSDPASLARAFAGVERVYLAVTANEHQVEQESNAIAVAEQSGAYAVVKLGVIGQSPQAPLRFARNHAAVFETLQATSLRWTLLQANGFMQNVLASAEPIRQGRYTSALGDAKVSRVDARDVAAVAVRALTEEGHEGSSYTLTGPEAISDPQIAEELGVSHVQASDEEIAATLRSAGVPEWTVEGLIEVAELERSGAAAGVAPDVEALLGRPARSFGRFAAEHRDAFAPG